MNAELNIIGMIGSASKKSSNLPVLKVIAEIRKSAVNIEIIDTLTESPHFRTGLSDENTPVDLRNKTKNTDGIPEYVISYSQWA